MQLPQQPYLHKKHLLKKTAHPLYQKANVVYSWVGDFGKKIYEKNFNQLIHYIRLQPFSIMECFGT